jgi:hypothetical protein
MYDKTIKPLCPVAVKLGQSTLHAPAHDQWRTVTCDVCAEKFAIGPHRIHGSRITAQECAKRLEAQLASHQKRWPLSVLLVFY